MCWISLKTPPCYEKRDLMLEGPRSSPNKESNNYEGYDWKESVFIIPIQSWIDEACKNHDLSCYI